ncbi:MAG: hypothetical protein E7I68_02330 [Neisseria sp.]|nr:hypothetical protein [Neisseria sp.]
MSYLKDVKESLKNIDELCDDALKEDDDYAFYIKQIQSMVGDAISDFESLIYELKLGKEKLIEATSIIEEYIDGKD